MKKYILLLSVAYILYSCGDNGGKMNSLTQKEEKEGWILLFDGETTNGWHLYGGNTAGEFWTASDGSLYPAQDREDSYPTNQKRDLVTDNEFGDFHLKIEWKISPEGNSGIIFYIKEDGDHITTYVTGPELQVVDNGTPTKPGHPDSKIFTHRAGDLYDLLASEDAANPQGEWNQTEIISKDGKLDFYLNGKHNLSTTLWDDHWRDMIAIGKFKNLPDFGSFKKGKIALQYHGDAVWFRNIKIRNL